MITADEINGTGERSVSTALPVSPQLAGSVPEPLRGLSVAPALTSISTRPLAHTLHDVRAFLCRYVVLADDEGTAIALWVAHTHAIEAADCTPYLQITS